MRGVAPVDPPSAHGPEFPKLSQSTRGVAGSVSTIGKGARDGPERIRESLRNEVKPCSGLDLAG